MNQEGIKRFHSNLYFVGNLSVTADFYNKLGFNVAISDDAVRIRLGDFTLAFIEDEQTQSTEELGASPKGIGLATYVEVNDIDNLYKHTISSGISAHSELKSWPWGKREFTVKDPDDYKIVFYSPTKD